MGYRIEYDSGRKKKFSVKQKRLVPAWLILSALGAAALLLFGRRLTYLLLPGDPDVTAAALSEMAFGLKEGQSLSEAVSAFCREIVTHANVTG